MNCEALLFDPDIDEGGLIARAGDCFAPRKYCVKFYPKNRTESLHGFLHDISLKQLPTVEVVIKALDDESSSGECRFTLETEEGVWSTISHFTIHVYDEFRNKGVGTDLILCMHFIINSIDRNLVKMTHSEINPEDESYFSRLLAFIDEADSSLARSATTIERSSSESPSAHPVPKLHFWEVAYATWSRLTPQRPTLVNGRDSLATCNYHNAYHLLSFRNLII